MLKDIKEKYNNIKSLTRIEDMLVTKGVTEKNFCHEELLLHDYGDEEFCITLHKHCLPQNIPRPHDLKEKQISQLSICKMEQKVTTSGDLFHNKTLANALFKPSFCFHPCEKPLMVHSNLKLS